MSITKTKTRERGLQQSVMSMIGSGSQFRNNTLKPLELKFAKKSMAVSGRTSIVRLPGLKSPQDMYNPSPMIPERLIDFTQALKKRKIKGLSIRQESVKRQINNIKQNYDAAMLTQTNSYATSSSFYDPTPKVQQNNREYR